VRLEVLERSRGPVTVPRLTIVDVTTFPDEDRDAYWNGDDAVIDRYAPSAPDPPPGTIHTRVVDLYDAWRATRHLTDAEADAYEERRFAEEGAAERERLTEGPVVTPEPAPRSVLGWERDGKPIDDRRSTLHAADGEGMTTLVPVDDHHDRRQTFNGEYVAFRRVQVQDVRREHQAAVPFPGHESIGQGACSRARSGPSVSSVVLTGIRRLPSWIGRSP
jgi:hypothetical protein